MSKLRPKSDVERTVDMLDLLHARFGASVGPLEHMPPEYVVIEEVADGTGFARRWADVLVLNCWRSGGFELDGFEVKASRSDLKRELANPKKHEAVARYCDRWTLVAWDQSVIEGFDIPADWGVVVTRDSVNGRELHQVRRAPKRTPEPFPRSFVASLVRNAHQQSPGAALLARVARHAHREAERQAAEKARHDRRQMLRPLATLLFGRDDWRWPEEARDPEKLIAAAVARLEQPALALAASPAVDRPHHDTETRA